MHPSAGCGPFRIYSSESYIMFDAVSNLVLSFHDAKDVFYYVADDRVMVAIGFCLWYILFIFILYFYIFCMINVILSYKNLCHKVRKNSHVYDYPAQPVLAATLKFLTAKSKIFSPITVKLIDVK